MKKEIQTEEDIKGEKRLIEEQAFPFSYLKNDNFTDAYIFGCD